MSLRDHPLIQTLVMLDLPKNDFAVFGSGPLLAAGLVDQISDLDLVARGAAWEKAKTLGPVALTKSGFQVVSLCDGRIEVFDGWAPGDWNLGLLIDGAKIIEGIHFVTLAQVLYWKRLMNRPKDAEHIRLLQEHICS